MNLSKDSYESIYNSYREYLLLKNYSKHTLNTYLCNFRLYHKWCTQRKIRKIYVQERVKQYLVYRIENGAKWQTMNNIYSAMRKLFREVLELEWSIKKVPRPKQERHLPELISQQEVFRIIQSCRLTKHRAILITLYASGLRSSELCNLRLDDIDSDRLQFRIRKGKGAKDRYVQVPRELIEYLREYFRECRPKNYLFNGRQKGTKMSVASLRWPIRESKKRFGLTKKISPHTFRHCYATHHLESGTDLVFLQQNLGHKYLKTTARYIHLCKDRYKHVKHPIVAMLKNL